MEVHLSGSSLSLLISTGYFAALFLLDNRLEVYLWLRGGAESSAPAWHDEQKCAMQTALRYCTGEAGSEAGGRACSTDELCVSQR